MPVEFLTRVRVYSNGAVIIPREVRARLNIEPNNELLLIANNTTILLVPEGMTAQILVGSANQTLVDVLDQIFNFIRGGGMASIVRGEGHG